MPGERPTAGSLFSGVGGFDLAIEHLGYELRWQVENNDFCNKVLEQHWPDTKRYGDIEAVDVRGLERVDLVFGGFPCQPWSVAGQNRGESDDRNLWPETARIIRGVRPRYVFLENVPNLLAHPYFGRILGDLAEGGYDAEWGCFTAAEVGASHRRDRLFILGYPRGQRWIEGRPQSEGQRGAPESDGTSSTMAGARCEQRVIQQRSKRPESAGGCGYVADTRHSEPPRRVRETSGSPRESCGELAPQGRPMADAQGAGSPHGVVRSGRETQQSGLEHGRFPPSPSDLDAWAQVLAEMPEVEPAFCRVANGAPDRTHRLAALGNAVVPTQAVYAFRQLWGQMST